MKFSKLDSIPLVLKIASFALVGIGVLQLLSLFFPSLGPGIEGKELTSPILIVCMGIFHTLLGLAILTSNKLAVPAIIALPAIQYGVFYLNHGLPETEALKLHAIFTGGWVLFFGCYLFFTKAKYYFRGQPNA
ncbi:hypothetical protein [Marinobacter mobilis]|uniref:hypothetical protein n=1 Tax=Marinobacter mobilis TaxID=488533 RepID=UPI0035C6ED13